MYNDRPTSTVWGFSNSLYVKVSINIKFFNLVKNLLIFFEREGQRANNMAIFLTVTTEMMKLHNLSARKINFICIFSFLIWWNQGYMVHIEESAMQSGHMFLRQTISEIISTYLYIYLCIYSFPHSCVCSYV